MFEEKLVLLGNNPESVKPFNKDNFFAKSFQWWGISLLKENVSKFSSCMGLLQKYLLTGVFILILLDFFIFIQKLHENQYVLAFIVASAGFLITLVRAIEVLSKCHFKLY